MRRSEILCREEYPYAEVKRVMQSLQSLCKGNKGYVELTIPMQWRKVICEENWYYGETWEGVFECLHACRVPKLKDNASDASNYHFNYEHHVVKVEEVITLVEKLSN